MTQNGKRVNKSDAKQAITGYICRIALGAFKDKTTHEVLTFENMGTERIEKIQAEMNEYKFTRRSIHDTVICKMVNYTDEQKKAIHDFCYGSLKDGK